jgi:hypothetical protein
MNLTPTDEITEVNRGERLGQGKTSVCNQKTSKKLIAEFSDRAVYIGRESRRARPPRKESIWHNPFRVPQDAATNDEACAMYREYLLKKPELLGRLKELRGKLLVCWCKPDPCHGDVLIELLEKEGA